jgi:glycosyltransferase involved in cell wall biosynthesis
MKVLLTTARAWWLGHTAKAFSNRGALAAFWMADRNRTGVPDNEFGRIWPYHLAMKPFYQFASQIWQERATYWFLGLYDRWLRSRLRSPNCPKFQVAHATAGFGKELFRRAAQIGALKVVDCPNSHPTTLYGFWQRECDIWCPGERVPIPWWMFSRMNSEIEMADMIIVQSKFCKESMVLNGISESKVFVNVMGVDTSIFKKRPRVPPKPRFVAVGTICVRKGFQYLFRAFEQVKRVLPEAELICIGDDKHDFRKERPRWKGTYTQYISLPHAEVSALLQTCTAFVFPSQEEGIARAQMEALASGLPVIGTHEGGATTVVDDGVEGFIVRGRDPGHIAAAMIKLATDPVLNQRMGDAAYKRGAVSNTWQDYGDRLMSEYQRHLGNLKS